MVRFLSSNGCPGLDTKQRDGEAPVLELWGIGKPLHCYYFHVNSLLGSHIWVKKQRLLLLFHSFVSFFFYTSVSWWFLTGIWETANFLKSPGPLSVFWLILIMLWFGWSPLVLLFPSLPVPIPILWWLYQEHQWQVL